MDHPDSNLENCIKEQKKGTDGKMMNVVLKIQATNIFNQETIDIFSGFCQITHRNRVYKPGLSYENIDTESLIIQTEEDFLLEMLIKQ